MADVAYWLWADLTDREKQTSCFICFTEFARMVAPVPVKFRHETSETRKSNIAEMAVFLGKTGAGDEIRTHDIDLGKVALYP